MKATLLLASVAMFLSTIIYGQEREAVDNITATEKSNTNTTVANEKGDSSIDVKGTVVNSDKEPLAGITVKVKGTQIATSTNINGEFILKNLPEDAILVFSGAN